MTQVLELFDHGFRAVTIKKFQRTFVNMLATKRKKEKKKESLNKETEDVMKN